MQWFTGAWWRWRLAQARGRNPLVRTTDRVEVGLLALAILVSLIVIPFAGAIGTAVHDEHAQRYAAQQHDRHRVAAPATAGPTSKPHGPVAVVQARWRAGDVESAGNYSFNDPAKDGSGVGIWVDNTGRHVSPPAASWQAGVDAVVAAAALWLSVTAGAALLVGLVRQGLRHARYNAWNREMAGLVHDDGGTTNRRR
jgi:hypothetical protein